MGNEPWWIEECDESTAQAWSLELFASLHLGDERLDRRAVRVAQDWASRPGATLGRASGDKAGAKAAYRLIENERVEWRQLGEAVYEYGARCCEGHKVVFVVQDTTMVTYPCRAPIEGLGPVTTSKAQGLLVHTSLAVSEKGVPLGIVDQQIWTRPAEDQIDHDSRPPEERESRKWLDGMRGSQARLRAVLGQDSRFVYVMDREGDVHEVFAEALEEKHGLVVRAAHDRRVRAAEKHLFEVVSAAPAAGRHKLKVPRRVGGEPKRTATLTVRFCRVTLDPRADSYPKKRSPLELNCVLVREEKPPKGSRALEWCLLTTEPVETLKDALRIIDIYTKRWRIEELHLILKSGCRVEEHHFEHAARISKIVTILSAVAALLLMLTYVARTHPTTPADKVLTPLEVRVLFGWAKWKHKADPPATPTAPDAVYWIGRLGGHTGNKRDGPPGVRTLWRGWNDLQLLMQGARTVLNGSCG